MKKEITNWLQGPRDYYEGMNLYIRHGNNRVLKQRFSTKSSTNEALLFSELCKLASLSEDQARKLPRNAKNKVVKEETTIVYSDDILLAYLNKLGISTAQFDLNPKTDIFPENISSQGDEAVNSYHTARDIYTELPETIRKTIKLREQYPFLSDDSCPDEIKLLVHDMFTEYDKYRLAHKNLSEAPEDATIEELFTQAETAVESYLSNRQIWEELDYYKENGTILGVHPKLENYSYAKEISELNDADLAQKRANARSNVSRAKKEEILALWNQKLDIIEKEIEKRKK